MSLKRLLIANRGEIAIRIARAAAHLGITTLGIYSKDDAASAHLRFVDKGLALSKQGVSAYLDGDEIIEAATGEDCDAVHPGYGFLAEDADFARACEQAGLTFVGPRPEVLDLFGNKASARARAEEQAVPILRGSDQDTSLEECRAFFASLGEEGAVMLKAVAGGGGRGMRPVTKAEDLEDAYPRCRSEAEMAFGSPEVYIEECVRRPRHVEVQILGDKGGNIIHLGTRECSLQRRRQKLIELAPAPDLEPDLVEQITGAAMKLAQSVNYSSLGTFEFLVSPKLPDGFAFIEANARVQVEHTVTEEVTGIDLVEAQLEIAADKTLDGLGISSPIETSGLAMQLRINAESLDADGQVRPASGEISVYEPPSGPQVRIDSCGHTGFRPNPNFDTLLAKLIVHSRDPSPLHYSAVRFAPWKNSASRESRPTFPYLLQFFATMNSSPVPFTPNG